MVSTTIARGRGGRGDGGLTDLGSVICSAENQFRSSVVTRANIRHVRLIFHENLGTTKITQLQDTRAGVQQQILWLDIAMADPLGVDVGQGAEKLINVQLDLEVGHCGLHLVEVSRRPVNGLGDVLLDEVEVYLILLPQKVHQCMLMLDWEGVTYSLPIRVVEGLEFHDIGMTNNAHDLQLTVLDLVSNQRPM